VNREIEIRAKTTNSWIYRYLERSNIKFSTEKKIQNLQIHDFKNSIRLLIQPETIGQYIGLKDKNGKKIYEGDVVKTSLFVYKVEWNNKVCGFFPFAFNPDIEAKECEVIGNIFDNPELLEEK